MKQAKLFAEISALPEGFVYRPDFLDENDERTLLDEISRLVLKEASYKEFTAKRRIASYGGRYDFSKGELLPAGPVPEFLFGVRERVAAWTGVAAQRYTHALVSEYRPGTQLGWHRDVPDFEEIAGISLGGRARMRLRPYPPAKGRRDLTRALDLEQRSAYAISGPARWGWQHAISATKELRYSITFRTPRR